MSRLVTPEHEDRREARSTESSATSMRIAEPPSKLKDYIDDERLAAPAVRRPADAHAWRTALVSLGLSLAWLLVWYASTAAGIVEIWWRSATFTHGFVVPPITLWLIWRQRRSLAAMTPRPALAWLAVLVAAGAAWLVGSLAAINAVKQLAFVTMLISVVPIVLGTEIGRRLSFPLGFLYFAVPIGEFLLPRLMEWTADFTVFAVQLSGVPIHREGLHFVIPSGRWSIVEACSGIRYLIASIMVGTLYAYCSYRTWSRRLGFVAVAIAVPIVANWLRAYMIVMIGHLSNNRFAVGIDHLIYGWVFFGVVMFLMFAVGARWRDLPAHKQGRDAAPVGASVHPVAAHYRGAAVLAMAVTSIFVVADRLMEQAIATEPVTLQSVEVPGWATTAGGLDNWKPHYENPSAESHATFRKDRRAVGLYVAYYRNQGDERKLVSSQNVLVPSNDRAWRTVAGGTRTLQIAGSGPVDARYEEFSDLGDRRLVAVKLYWVNGMWTGSDYVAKLYSVLSRIRGDGDDGAVVIVYAEKNPAMPANDTIDAFLEDAGSSIGRALEQARAVP
jgi:exosortase A